jgi:metal-sulfur cluster biosynthetic enzyme
MLADLDLLLTAVFCTADDLLPEKAKNARRSVTDAEVVTLAVAQAIMGIDTDHGV